MQDLEPGARRRTRPGWLLAPVLGAAAASTASGFAQFSITAVIGDVAAEFGQPSAALDPASQIGLTGTTLGVALAMVRLAGLGALPATALADRVGRRRVLLASLAAGLAVTALSGASTGFWIWVALVTLARPWLSAVNGVAGVIAAEETSTRDRSAAIGVISGAYGLGAGAVAVLRALLPDEAWRPVMGLSLLAMLALPALVRVLREPAIFVATPVAARTHRLTSLATGHRARALAMAAVTFGMGVATGPGFGYLFVYGEKIAGASPEAMSILVLAAGPTGLFGLVAGRWGAERFGRRPTAAVAMVGTAGCIALAYAGGLQMLVVGYLLGITISAAFGPPMGALVAEAFPTSERSTATAWISASGVLGAVTGLAMYGILVDTLGSFGAAAMLLVIPVLVLAGLIAVLPETRGRELDADGF